MRVCKYHALLRMLPWMWVWVCIETTFMFCIVCRSYEWTMMVCLKAATEFFFSLQRTRKRHFIQSFASVCECVLACYVRRSCVCVRIVYMVRLCLFTWACRYFEIIVFIAFNGKLSSTHNHCHLVEVIDITCDSVSIETKIELYFRRSNFSQWMNGVCAYHFAMIFMIYGKTTSSLTRTRFLHMLLDTRTHSHRTSHISHHTCESMSEHSNCTTIFSNFTF